MRQKQIPEHHAQEWGTIGAALFGIGVTGTGALVPLGFSARLWSDVGFLAALGFVCLLGALGLYALSAVFVLPLPLPPTLRERVERRRPTVRRAVPVEIVFDHGARPTAPRRRRPVDPDKEARRKYERTIQRALTAAHESQEHARRQLVASIKTGSILRRGGHADGAFGLDWREETEAMVRQSAGEGRAARLAESEQIEHWLTCLRDLGRSYPRGFRASESWDAYVERMTSFRARLGPLVAAGEHLRTELSDRHLDAEPGAARVDAWLRDVDEAFSSEFRLREALRTGLPTKGTGHDGLTTDERASAWRVEPLLQRLQSLLPLVAQYVDALNGEVEPATAERQGA